MCVCVCVCVCVMSLYQEVGCYYIHVLFNDMLMRFLEFFFLLVFFFYIIYFHKLKKNSLTLVS